MQFKEEAENCLLSLYPNATKRTVPLLHTRKLDDGNYEVRMTRSSLKKVIESALISKLRKFKENLNRK